jgi:hypothetical protein
MSLSKLSIEQLEQAVELLKQRELLLSKLDNVNRHLQRLENGQAHIPFVQDSGNNSAISPKRGKQRRKLQPSILKALNAAGAKGLSVKELAAQIKTSPASLSVWLYTTGKKTPGVKKIAPGTFAYISK